MTDSTTPIETRPVAVTVFPDRARVTRAGATSLAVGIQRLEVRDLPLALLPESVRASGSGAARARLLGVSTRREHFAETPAEAVRDLERRIQDLEDADADQAARAGVVEKEQRYLDGLAAQSEMFARGLALRNRTAEEQAAIFDFISGRSRALQTELLAIARERRERGKELDRLRRELKAMQSARPRQRLVAVVELDVSEPGDFSLALTYVVTGASWRPLYDLRLVDGSLQLSYLAEVQQNTGEAWPEVELSLSTARPSLSLEIPELQPWYVHPRRPPVPVAPKRAAGPLPAPSAAPMAAQSMPEPVDMRALVAPARELEFEPAAVSEAGAALTYRLSGTAEVPGNGDPRKVTVGTASLQPDFTYVTAPKLEAVCYRRAEVKNTSPYSLLPGAAQLFEGDEFLGSTQLGFAAPGQSFELALGADERLRVERELAARDTDKASLIGDRRRLRYGYTIDLENLTDRAQVVLVRDQIPVPRDEQIRVRLEGADPKPSEHSELNLLEWKLTLDKGARRTIRFDFNVDFPRSMDVVGLL